MVYGMDIRYPYELQHLLECLGNTGRSSWERQLATGYSAIYQKEVAKKVFWTNVFFFSVVVFSLHASLFNQQNRDDGEVWTLNLRD